MKNPPLYSGGPDLQSNHFYTAYWPAVYFNPTTYIPHIGQRHTYTSYEEFSAGCQPRHPVKTPHNGVEIIKSPTWTATSPVAGSMPG